MFLTSDFSPDSKVSIKLLTNTFNQHVESKKQLSNREKKINIKKKIKPVYYNKEEIKFIRKDWVVISEGEQRNW